MLLVDVPGVEPGGFDLSVERGHLQLLARTTSAEQPDRDGTTFSRRFKVPSSVDAQAISAELTAGVLRIQLNKSEEAKPQRITVTTN